MTQLSDHFYYQDSPLDQHQYSYQVVLFCYGNRFLANFSTTSTVVLQIPCTKSNRGTASLILEVLIFKCKLKDYRYNSLSTIFQKIFSKPANLLCVDHVTQQMARPCSAAWSMKYGSKRFSGWGGWER